MIVKKQLEAVTKLTAIKLLARTSTTSILLLSAKRKIAFADVSGRLNVENDRKSLVE